MVSSYGLVHVIAGLLTVSDVAPKGADAGAPPRFETGMVKIPVGQFWMGSKGRADERPVHRVKVAAFEMDATEVTAEAYQRCVMTGRCSEAAHLETCNAGRPGREKHPANCVSWSQAKAFCGWAGKRLPSEAEWEYAARGIDGRRFPWGNEETGEQVCWKRGKGQEGTCAVDSRPAGDSPFGVHDLAGNVWEWTADAFSPSYGQKRTETQRVIRGGGWSDAQASDLSATVRGRWPPSHQTDIIGFRCVR